MTSKLGPSYMTIFVYFMGLVVVGDGIIAAGGCVATICEGGIVGSVEVDWVCGGGVPSRCVRGVLTGCVVEWSAWMACGLVFLLWSNIFYFLIPFQSFFF